ncbi:Hsp20/alpha crystallin family protein [Paratractidigestivibacter sp.]|uniref:Hsp20/alpha crystallin family protein n=1 Tax=Paratractidigestivibacter sp. TaxID=2847316 RepID=UPI002ABD42AA|nr:Hsp20 family protein [Paratractidigestivibacter sp.]
MASMVPYVSRGLRNWSDPFDYFFGSPVSSLAKSAETVGAFKMNVEDAGEKYVVTAELAGVKREDIDVELNEGRLSISVDHKEPEEEKGKNYLYKETGEWSATRGVYLKDAATAGLSAKFEGGVLTINVPKQVEQNNVTKITID